MMRRPAVFLSGLTALGLLASPAFAAPIWAAQAAPGLPIWRLAAATIFCIALAFIAARLLNHRLTFANAEGRPLFDLTRGKFGSRRLRIVEFTAASPNLAICLVECAGVEYLVASSSQALLLLDRRPIDAAIQSRSAA